MESRSLKELDCSRMLMNPDNPRLSEFVEGKVKGLKRLADMVCTVGFAKTMLYKYILLMYDPRSPILEMTSLDWYGKKFEAVSYSGFEYSQDKDGYFRFDKRVGEMVVGKIDKINDMIISFIGWINNSKWAHRVFLYETHLQYLHGSLKGSDDETHQRARREVRQIMNEMNELDKELVHSYEETEEFMARFYYQIERSRLAIRPEDYAQKLAEGDSLRGDNPYGVNYIVDRIKFVGDELPKDAGDGYVSTK